MPNEIVGRGTELAAVERFVERARGGLAALVLEGEPGIGKTTIWTAAVGTARDAGFTVLTSGPARSEQGLTLGGLTDLLGDVDAAVLAGLPDPQRHALEIALLRIAPSGALPDQRTLSVAVAGVLRLLTSSAPVLVAIDDAQWLDDSSAAILAYAVRRLTDRPLGLLVSVRAGPGGDGALDLPSAVSLDATERIRLGPMSLASLHRLLQVRLGRSFPRLVLVRIEAASGGNALYALEIARALPSDMVATNAPVPLPVPDSLGLLMAGRISALPRPAREAMLLAAAAAEPTVDTLDRARPGIEEALLPAFAQGLVCIRRPNGQVQPSAARPSGARPRGTRRGAPRSRRAGGGDGLARCPGTAPRAGRGRSRRVGSPRRPPRRGSAERRSTRPRSISTRSRRPRRTWPIAPSSARGWPPSVCSSTCRRWSGRTASSRRRSRSRRPGPARAEALSIRALVRYYHGRVPDAVAMGEQALAEAGDDEAILRARILGRVAFLVMQLDLERGLALVEEAVGLLEAREERSIRTCWRTSSCCGQRRAGAGPADEPRGHRPRTPPDHPERTVVGARRRRRQRVRPRSRDRRPRPSHRDDPRADPGEVRAWGR